MTTQAEALALRLERLIPAAPDCETRSMGGAGNVIT